MKVRLKKELPISQKEYEQKYSAINPEKVYTVLGTSYDNVRILDEDGEPIIYPMIYFDMIDNTIEDGWMVWMRDDIDEYPPQENFFSHLSPKEFQGYFYEDFFDGKRESIEIFLAYTKKHNLTVVANLAYAPHFRKAYYQDLLAKIDAREAEE